MEPQRLRKRLHEVINKERKRRKLKPLKLSKSLTKSANREALKRKNCTVHYAVKGETHTTVAKRIVKEWLRNPNHRKHILSNKYNRIGIGVSILWNKNIKEYEIYVCKKFGSPKDKDKKKSNKSKSKQFNLKKINKNAKKLIIRHKKVFEYFLVAVMLYIILYIAFTVS
ncbi:SCP-like extracellular [Methanocaldococcus vulcanius M7]|uniref:SCP-like extracellular n=1 Tax=Methanocaldococcus vulcanius (strain ATCC 700851 / DSM 12094 / M7) TaxID=579137 RepID=C9RFV0_METVM|nr:CAP domain-containing protein [Methanocaldococcus vulcanius]ACX72452.1 SCP-like extracellular [Methanocaldococcus vulcanius M7]